MPGEEEEGQDLKGGSFTAWLNEDNEYIDGDNGEGSLTRAMEAMDLNTHTPDDEDYLNLMANRIQSTWYEEATDFEGALPPQRRLRCRRNWRRGIKPRLTKGPGRRLPLP